MSLDPAKRKEAGSGGVEFKKKATYSELQAENEKLKARVAELEKQLGVEPAAEEAEAEEAEAEAEAEAEEEKGGE